MRHENLHFPGCARHSSSAASAALARSRSLVATGVRAQCLGMMSFTDLTSIPSDHPTPLTDRLRAAVAVPGRPRLSDSRGRQYPNGNRESLQEHVTWLWNTYGGAAHTHAWPGCFPALAKIDASLGTSS